MENSNQFQTNDGIIRAINLLEEHTDLDFKASISLEGGKKEKAELTKDIIAMANSCGGLIIGGVKETNSGFEKCGMQQEELRSFDSTKLNQFVNNYSDPPINSTTRIVNDGTYSYGVIIVPEFPEQPHIIKKNYPDVFNEGDLLVRTSNNESRRASAHELREILNRGLTRQQGIMAKMIQSIIPSNSPQILEPTVSVDHALPFDVKDALKEYKGFRIVKITPIDDFSAIKLYGIGNFVTQSVIKSKGNNLGSFPPMIPDGSNETRLPIGLLLRTEYNQIQSLRVSFFGTNGLIFNTANFWEDQTGLSHPEGSIGLLSCIKMVFEGLLFMVQYYRNLNWKGKNIYEFSVESVTPRQFVMDTQNYWPLFRNYQNPMAIPISIKRLVDTNLVLEDIEKLTIDIMKEFLWLFNWDLDEEHIQKFINYIKEKYTAIPEFLNQTDGN